MIDAYSPSISTKRCKICPLDMFLANSSSPAHTKDAGSPRALVIEQQSHVLRLQVDDTVTLSTGNARQTDLLHNHLNKLKIHPRNWKQQPEWRKLSSFGHRKVQHQGQVKYLQAADPLWIKIHLVARTIQTPKIWLHTLHGTQADEHTVVCQRFPLWSNNNKIHS